MSFETLIGAIIGSIFSLFFEKFIESVQIIRKPGLTGEWYSNWETSTRETGWIQEKVVVSRGFGRLKMKIVKTDYDFNYVSTAKLIEGKFLQGTYKSVKSGSYSSGSFTLFIAPQGNCIFGNYIGLDLAGNMRSGKVILSRNKNDIEGCKKLSLNSSISTGLSLHNDAKTLKLVFISDWLNTFL